MKNLTQFAKYQLPAIIWAIGIFILSSIPDLSPPSLEITYEDKIIHTIIYAILGYLVTRAFYYNTNNRMKKFTIVISISICLFYGISDEIHQHFVPGRYSEIGDLMADFTGIILAQLFFVCCKKFV